VQIEDASNSNAVVATPTLTNSTVTFNIANLSVGTHNLFAVYSGDAANAGSQSGTAPQTVNALPVVGSPVVNGDFAGIVGASELGSIVTITTNGSHGFSAGNTVVIQGYTTAARTALNGPWTILDTPTPTTFRFDAGSPLTFTAWNSSTSSSPTQNNSEGFAISDNAIGGSDLTGAQRSMVDSVVYTFSAPVSLAVTDFTLATVSSFTHSGNAVPATLLPGLALTSLNGGSTWVLTWVDASATGGGTVIGHSIGDGVYNLTLLNSTRSTDTFYRLFGDITGPNVGGSGERVNNSDKALFSSTYLENSGTAGYLPAIDFDGNGRINNSDSAAFSANYLSSWSGLTPTI
jgi:hypothetical protein